jgi:hypothetical protein
MLAMKLPFAGSGRLELPATPNLGHPVSNKGDCRASNVGKSAEIWS